MHRETATETVGYSSHHEHDETPVSRPNRHPRDALEDSATEEEQRCHKELSPSAQEVTHPEADDGPDHGAFLFREPKGRSCGRQSKIK